MKHRLKNLSALGLLAIVAGAVYSNALHSAFIMDDHWMFQEDRVAWTRAKVESLIVHKPLAPALQGYEIDLSYRPLSQILPMAGYLMFKNNFFAYHSVNLFLFILCVFMIFYFLQTLFNNFKIALTTALLFAAHPINSLMVNYISAHIFSIQLLLMIVSCLLFVRHRTNNYFSMAASLGCFFLATLCHESALALPLFLTGLAVTVLNLDVKHAAKKLWPFYALMLILGMFWSPNIFHTGEMVLFKDQLMPWVAYPAGVTQLMTWYITQMVFLYGVVLMLVIPVEKISVLYGWTVLLSVIGIILLTRSRWAKDRQIIWALGWLVIGFLIVMAGARFQPAYGLTIEPHWLYFASIGLFFIAARGLWMFEKYHRLLPVVLIAFLMFGYTLATRQLNRTWADPVVYGEYFMANNPGFEKARIFLANAYFQQGRYREAEPLYLSSLKNMPTDWMPFNSLGIIADIEDRPDEALEYFQKALQINAGASGVLSNMAIVYTRMNKWDEAQSILRQAIEHNPWLLTTRINLATVYEKQGRREEAAAVLEENLRIAPGDSQTLASLAKLKSGQP